MRTISVISRKGGTGKTTVSTSLGLAAHIRGQRVVIADIDPQHSSYCTLSMRQALGPRVEATSGGKLYPLHACASLNGVDLFLVDTPAGLDAAVCQAIQVADLCLVVTRPNYLDLASALSVCAGVEQGPPNGVIGAEEGPLIPMV